MGGDSLTPRTGDEGAGEFRESVAAREAGATAGVRAWKYCLFSVSSVGGDPGVDWLSRAWRVDAEPRRWW
jgi:hypothetical protein